MLTSIITFLYLFFQNDNSGRLLQLSISTTLILG
uniref:Uncharacterized protein n=1 Tax=Arundo donax TaxID=35708 RepID=A0A0A9HSE4_ARUDO